MKTRKAYTLVEMLVSVALVLFVMALLTQAFTAALQVFRDLKGAGDLDDRLRMATTLFRRDLAAEHFESGRKLSDANFWLKGPPSMGYFRIWQGTPIQYGHLVSGTTILPANTWEGSDHDLSTFSGVNSARITDQQISMTVRLRGNTRQDFFSTDVSSDASALQPTPLLTYGLTDGLNPASRFQSYNPGPPVQANYTSQWAQVAYFLRPSGDVTPSGLPLFNLHRREQLVVPNPDGLNYTASQQVGSQRLLSTTAYANLSCMPNPNNLGPNGLVYFNGPIDLTIPQHRFGIDLNAGNPAYPWFPLTNTPIPTPGPLRTYPKIEEGDSTLLIGLPGYGSMTGSDILLPNVVSFEIRILIDDPLARRGARELRTIGPNGNVKVKESDDNSIGPVLSSPPMLFDPFVDLFDSQALLPEARPLKGTRIFVQPLNALHPNGNGDFGSPWGSSAYDPLNNNYIFANPKVFDTWSSFNDNVYDYSNWNSGSGSKAVPLQINILAVQITLRLWDRNTQQVRQVTFVQDM